MKVVFKDGHAIRTGKLAVDYEVNGRLVIEDENGYRFMVRESEIVSRETETKAESAKALNRLFGF